MSITKASSWLLSHKTNDNFADLGQKVLLEGVREASSPSFSFEDLRASTIAITGGKGGVGKTSVAIKIAKTLSNEGNKVLLIDCDYNLSDTYVKLGLPLNDGLYEIVAGKKTFLDVVYRMNNFHLLSGSSGNLHLLENNYEIDQAIIQLIVQLEKKYDYIILDLPAGLHKAMLTICAYVDKRFVVVTPDKSSLTDSYALMKVLKQKYGVNSNHLLVNKVSNEQQYKRIVKVLSETVENFLMSHLKVLGKVSKSDKDLDLMDQVILGDETNIIHHDFIKVVQKIAEENAAQHCSLYEVREYEQDVQTTI